jgi:sulfoxide reductase heme-binding subunit YedZ
MTPAAARKAPLPWMKPGVFLGALVPLAVLMARGARGALGANAIALLLNAFGLLALVFLVASLACTPLKEVLGWTWPIRLRRMLGLFAFFYAGLHLLTYAVVDQGLDWPVLLKDVAARPFITVGFAAFLLMVPLAVTSTNAMVKRLGFVKWKRLHRLAYVSGVLGALHFFLRVKSDLRQPLVYASVLAVLFAVRIAFWARASARQTKRV